MSSLTLRLSNAQLRYFSSSSSSRASVLFALGALSNSRETQHFNKISRLERFEHSPNLKLIKTSEIDPYPVPIERLLQNAPRASSSSQPFSPTAPRSAFRRSQDIDQIWDRRALLAGRALLAQTQAERTRLSRTISRLQRRESKQSTAVQKQLAILTKERQKMREEMRSAGFLILLSIGAATGFGMWSFWPRAEAVKDSSGEMGRRIAEKARASIPLPPAVSSVKDVSSIPAAVSPIQDAIVVAGAGAVPAAAVVTGEPTVAPAMVLEQARQAATASSWRSLFWKKS